MIRIGASGRARRALLLSLGILCTALAVAGVVLPGLPATEFAIAASYLFARSSPETAERLRRNRWFGASLRRFEETGGMPMRSKAIALASMWSGMAVSWFVLAGAGTTVQAVALGLGLAGTATVLLVVRTTPEGLR